jgi:hypothetical protein
VADPARYQLDARAPLTVADPALHRHVGVTVGQPFHHHGMNAVYVDVDRETVRVNTDAYGTCYPVGSTGTAAEEALSRTVAELDAVIAELAGHRARLATQLEVLDAMEWRTTL